MIIIQKLNDVMMMVELLILIKIMLVLDQTTRTSSSKRIRKRTSKTLNDVTEDVEIMVPLSNFWRTLEMPLINCEINLDLNWSRNCVIVANNAN